MTDIFLSYASDDKKIAEKIADILKSDGYTLWSDHQIKPGEHFSETLERKLSESKAVVVLWSGHSVNSDWVKEEARYAREQDKLLPVIVEHVQVPSSIQTSRYVSLKGWDGEKDHPAIEGLKKNIKQFMKGSV